MRRRVIVLPLALQELDESVFWYEQRSYGLGLRFTEAIYKKIDAILLNPDAYRIRFRGWREAVVAPHFPYNIVFKEVTPGLIVVSAIFHTSRHPRKKYWRWPVT